MICPKQNIFDSIDNELIKYLDNILELRSCYSELNLLKELLQLKDNTEAECGGP